MESAVAALNDATKTLAAQAKPAPASAFSAPTTWTAAVTAAPPPAAAPEVAVPKTATPKAATPKAAAPKAAPKFATPKLPTPKAAAPAKAGAGLKHAKDGKSAKAHKPKSKTSKSGKK
jgi:hypothetical protein